MGQRASIAIIGIDERPTERRMIPGLAKTLEELRPDGLTEQPHWVPIAKCEPLKNESNVAFTHSSEANIVRMYWHLRSRVGKHGVEGSLRRLVVLFNTGTIEVVDPDRGDGWETVVSKANTSSDTGAWDMSFTQLYDTGYVCISKGGVPQTDLLIEDDLIVPFEFPELPIMRCWLEESAEEYTQEQLDAGEHLGFKKGKVFIRYAFELRDGTLVKHSAPELIETHVSSDNNLHRTSFFRFYMEGYQQMSEPSNFEFWKDKISGVQVLMSEFLADGETELAEHLSESLWYEVTRFDYIDPSDDIEHEDLFRLLDFSDETLSGYSVADVDDGTHHVRSHGACDTYNSRVLLGNEKEDFATPFLNQKEGLYNHLIVASDRGLRVIGFPSEGVSVTLSNVVNMSSIAVYQRNNFQWEITFDGSGAYSCRINVNATTAKSFYIDISSNDVDYQGQDKELIVLPISDYVNRVASNSALSRVFSPMVELETETGEYQRIAEDRLVYTNAAGEWYPQGQVLFYPDIRAKKYTLFADLPLASGVVMDKLYSSSPRASSKANISAIIAKKLTIYSSATSASHSEPTGINSKTNVIGDKVRASEVNSVLSYNSRLVYRIGRSASKITGFAVNAQEVSQGQFGQYPLFVFKEDSVWALEQSGNANVVFGRITPIDASLGVDTEHKITNVGKAVFFASSQGIYLLTGARAELISDPVRSIINKVVCIGYRRSAEDKELVVALTNGKVYYYSMKFSRWYSSGQKITHFFMDSEKLYAFNDAHEVLDYQQEKSDAVTVRVVLDDVHFGMPDLLKRFRYFYLRGVVSLASGLFTMIVKLGSKVFTGANTKQVRPKWKSVYSAEVDITATMTPGQHYLEEIDTEFEVRYPRKLRRPE